MKRAHDIFKSESKADHTKLYSYEKASDINKDLYTGMARNYAYLGIEFWAESTYTQVSYGLDYKMSDRDREECSDIAKKTLDKFQDLLDEAAQVLYKGRLKIHRIEEKAQNEDRANQVD